MPMLRWPEDEGRDGAFASSAHATSPRVMVRVLAERWGLICELCETPIDLGLAHGHPAAVQVDHILPIGGPTYGPRTWANVRLAHAWCNNTRHAGEMTAEVRQQKLAQRSRDYADQVFWHANRALHEQRAVEAVEEQLHVVLEGEIGGDAENLIRAREIHLHRLYDHFLQLEDEMQSARRAFDIEAPERYDERLEGLTSWRETTDRLFAGYEWAQDDGVLAAEGRLRDWVSKPESGAVLPRFVVQALQREFGTRDWQDALADVLEALSYDDLDFDNEGVPTPRGTGDEYDGGYGPDSYFTRAMQRDD
jgi:hypothetical protein